MSQIIGIDGNWHLTELETLMMWHAIAHYFALFDQVMSQLIVLKSRLVSLTLDSDPTASTRIG